MNILGKSIWKAGVGGFVFLTLLMTGCSQHQPPAGTPAPAGTAVASHVPAAPLPGATPAQTFQPYTLLPQPAPKPKVVTHRHRALTLTLRSKHPYLVDADGHYYDVGRDRQGHICPIYRDPATKAVYPLYYDPSRDRMYRVAQADDGRYYRGYVGDSDERYYASNSDYTNDTDYESALPADRPEIIDSYNTYNTYNEGAPYYGNYPASAPAAHRHHNNDNWLWAIPVIVGAYLLLNPHHHHDHHHYAPQPQAIFRQQPPGRDFNQGPPFVTTQPGYPGHGGYPGHPMVYPHGSSRPPTTFAGRLGHAPQPAGVHQSIADRATFPGHHSVAPHQSVIRQIGNPARRLPPVANSTRPTGKHLRPVHLSARTIVRPEHHLPTAIHRAAPPAHRTPVFVRPRVRKPITPRELIRPQARRPETPARQSVRPQRHEPSVPRQMRPERHEPPVRHDTREPQRTETPRTRPAPPRQQRSVPAPRQRPVIQRSAPRQTSPRLEPRSQPHLQPRPERRPTPQNHPAPPRPQNRPSPPPNHPPQGSQHHGNDHLDHKDDQHH